MSNPYTRPMSLYQGRLQRRKDSKTIQGTLQLHLTSLPLHASRLLTSKWPKHTQLAERNCKVFCIAASASTPAKIMSNFVRINGYSVVDSLLQVRCPEGQCQVRLVKRVRRVSDVSNAIPVLRRNLLEGCRSTTSAPKSDLVSGGQTYTFQLREICAVSAAHTPEEVSARRPQHLELWQAGQPPTLFQGHPRHISGIFHCDGKPRLRKTTGRYDRV